MKPNPATVRGRPLLRGDGKSRTLHSSHGGANDASGGPERPVRYDTCDESMCLSSGLEAIVDRTDLLQAYGGDSNGDGDSNATAKTTATTTSTAAQNDDYPLSRYDCYYRPDGNDAPLCAGGRVGIPIPSEPTVSVLSPYSWFPDVPVEHQYYTCCLPDEEEAEDAASASASTTTSSGTTTTTATTTTTEEFGEDEDPTETPAGTGATTTVTGGDLLRRRCGQPKKVVVVAARQEEEEQQLFDTATTTTSTATTSSASAHPTMPCDDGDPYGRIYPRPMTKSMPYYPDTYLCCDEEEEEEETTTTTTTTSSAAAASGAATVVPDQSCDESRCLSRAVATFLPGFGCWAEGPGNLHVYSCSDGYVGIPVDTQPTFFDDGQVLHYYSCCPPSIADALAYDEDDSDEEAEPSSAAAATTTATATTTTTTTTETTARVTRHCSDPLVAELGNATNPTTELVCDDPVLKHPRRQNPNGHFSYLISGRPVTTETYVCCDVELKPEERAQQQQQQQQQQQEQQTELVLSAGNDATSQNGLATTTTTTTTTDISYLDQVNCVSACDPNFVFDCIAENSYGLLWPMACDDPTGVFVEPKVVGSGYLGGVGTNLFFYKYGCCRKGYGDGPFIKDAAFNRTIWPQLILSAVALSASLLLIVALLLSFYHGDDDNNNNKNGKRRTHRSSFTSSVHFRTSVAGNAMNQAGVEPSAAFDNSKTNSGGVGGVVGVGRDNSSAAMAVPNDSRSGPFEGKSGGTGPLEVSNRTETRDGSGGNAISQRSTVTNRRRFKLRDSGSAYNAYLIYLAIPDIVLNFWVVCMYGGYVNQTFNAGVSSYVVNSLLYERKTALDMAVILGCSAANLYLNLIVSRQIFTLLSNSRRRIRTPPPTFRTVGLQALAVYALAMVISLVRFFLPDVFEGIPQWVEVTVYFVISAGIPILYLCYACAVIWRRNLLPSLRGPLRILAMYFFRIIAVFVAMWLPGVLLLSLACNWTWDANDAGSADANILMYPIGLYFCSVQPILSTGMALTKPDVRAAVVKLLRLEYFRKDEQRPPGAQSDDDNDDKDSGLYGDKSSVLDSQLYNDEEELRDSTDEDKIAASGHTLAASGHTLGGSGPFTLSVSPMELSSEFSGPK